MVMVVAKKNRSKSNKNEDKSKDFEMMMLPSYAGRDRPKYTESEAESAGTLQDHYGSENSQSQAKPYYVAGRHGNRYNEYR